MKIKHSKTLLIALCSLPLALRAQTTVFSDNFSHSTVNSATPAAPTATSTSYQIISAKTWNPTPSIATGDFRFGIAATSSGTIEAQALFATSPITLATNGDYLSLQVTFTATSGILTTNGELGIGLYNSGQVGPIAGGLNGSATTSSSTAATGGAQNWNGYDSNLGFTNGVGGTAKASQISTRAPQTGADNNNQDLILAGPALSTSQAYQNPAASTVAAQTFAASVDLTPGGVYTEVFTITLAGPTTFGFTNSLYSGTGTGGPLLSIMGGNNTASYFLTNSFDGLAIGWHSAATPTAAEQIDISQISVIDSLAGGSGLPSNPIPLTYTIIGSTLTLNWAADHIGWTLQAETNSAGINAASWVDVPGSTGVDQENFTINPANGPVFFRLSETP